MEKYNKRRVRSGSNFDSQCGQVPRHLIGEAHGRATGVLVPIYYPTKQRPRDRGWAHQRGKPCCASLLCDLAKWLKSSRINRFGAAEKPVILISYYLFLWTETRITAGLWLKKKCSSQWWFVRQTQSGGAFGWGGTPVNFDNANVLLVSSIKTEISCGHKTYCMMVIVSGNTNCENIACLWFQPEEYSALNTRRHAHEQISPDELLEVSSNNFWRPKSWRKIVKNVGGTTRRTSNNSSGGFCSCECLRVFSAEYSSGCKHKQAMLSQFVLTLKPTMN